MYIYRTQLTKRPATHSIQYLGCKSNENVNTNKMFGKKLMTAFSSIYHVNYLLEMVCQIYSNCMLFRMCGHRTCVVCLIDDESEQLYGRTYYGRAQIDAVYLWTAFMQTIRLVQVCNPDDEFQFNWKFNDHHPDKSSLFLYGSEL